MYYNIAICNKYFDANIAITIFVQQKYGYFTVGAFCHLAK